MGFFDKVMFWRKKDGLESLPEFEDFKAPLGGERSGREPAFDFPEPKNEFEAYAKLEAKQPVQQIMPVHPARDNELILAKLDAIKTSLENINMRLERLERMARGEEEVYR